MSVLVRKTPLHRSVGGWYPGTRIVVFFADSVHQPSQKLAKVGRQDVVGDLVCGDGWALLVAALQFNAKGYGTDIRQSCIHECERAARINQVPL